jgi:ubiquitin-protein ligase E3 B
VFSDIKASVIVSEFENHETRAQVLMSRMPHLIPLRDRMVLFRKLIFHEKDAIISTPINVITIDRTRIVEDGYRQLSSISSSALRSTIRVKFINQLGLEEIGIDQDGVFKEFLELTLKKVTCGCVVFFTLNFRCSIQNSIYSKAHRIISSIHRTTRTSTKIT